MGNLSSYCSKNNISVISQGCGEDETFTLASPSNVGKHVFRAVDELRPNFNCWGFKLLQPTLLSPLLLFWKSGQ